MSASPAFYNSLRLLSRQSSPSLMMRHGHGKVDSWINQGQGPRGALPFKSGPRGATAFRVFGLWLALPVSIVFAAVALAHSKA